MSDFENADVKGPGPTKEPGERSEFDTAIAAVRRGAKLLGGSDGASPDVATNTAYQVWMHTRVLSQQALMGAGVGTGMVPPGMSRRKEVADRVKQSANPTSREAVLTMLREEMPKLGITADDLRAVADGLPDCKTVDEARA